MIDALIPIYLLKFELNRALAQASDISDISAVILDLEMPEMDGFEALKPVSLAAIKAEPKLANMSLVTSARLSVQPVTEAEWDIICRMGELK